RGITSLLLNEINNRAAIIAPMADSQHAIVGTAAHHVDEGVVLAPLLRRQRPPRRCRVILIKRVRSFEWGSRSRLISIPTLRRKVAGRRSPRPSASALDGQFLDLAARSPATPSRATRSSEAVPTHSSWVAISALIADAIASASSTPSISSF